jgi:virginiamycin B lyase
MNQRPAKFIRTAAVAFTLALAFTLTVAVPAAELAAPRPMSELVPTVVIQVGKTADWVAITSDAVWVASTGPFAVHRIDPKTNKLLATVTLPGEPCAGLAVGFGSLWIPLCTATPSLAEVDLGANRLTSVFPVGPAGAEGGVAASADSVWLMIDKLGSLARIDPATGATRQTVKLPAGSYNPYFSDGVIWVTRAEGAAVTAVDAVSGAILSTVHTGPKPRFLTAAAGAIWTLNQGDGTLTRIDAQTRQASKTIALGTPGHGGDIGAGAGKDMDHHAQDAALCDRHLNHLAAVPLGRRGR